MENEMEMPADQTSNGQNQLNQETNREEGAPSWDEAAPAPEENTETPEEPETPAEEDPEEVSTQQEEEIETAGDQQENTLQDIEPRRVLSFKDYFSEN